MQDTQLPPLSPPHIAITPAETINVKDVTDKLCQNINPLTAEDLSKILDQSTHQAMLCTNLILVSVDVIQRVVANPTRVKVNPKVPPSVSKTTSTQLLLLPPPPPPSATSDIASDIVLVLSAKKGEDTGVIE